MGPKDSFDVFYYAKLFLESKPQRTLRDDEVAPVFREPGVKTGYRLPGRNWGYYLASLFHVHSETLNVWTHLVGCVMMVYYLYSYALQHGMWIDESRRVIHIFNLCAVICTGLSALAHTCNSRSEFVFYISFQVDYMGIGIMTYSLGLVGFYVSCRNISLFTNMESYFLIWNTAMSWLFFLSCAYAQVMYSTKCVIRKHIIQSVSMFLHIVLSCFGILSRFYDCFYDDTCSYFELSHHMKYFLATFIAGVFFSSHFPEKFFPGKFDFACQSHQIFHVIVFYFLRLQSYAGETDHTSLKDSFPRSFPTWTAVFMSLSAVVIMDVLTILALKKYIPTSHKTKST